MAEILSYNPYRDMHNEVQFSAMFFGKNIQNIPFFSSTQTSVKESDSYGLKVFTFTGKERDSETGFSYFGTRYYDSDLMTGWLSVDPMADKYPSLSPYAYCAWNPIRLVDPDGEDIYWLDVTTGSLTLSQRTKDKTDKIIAGSYQGIGRAKSFEEKASITFSKGVLDGKKNKDYSKTGFVSSNGTQKDAISVAKFISFCSYKELSGVGFTTGKSLEEAEIFAWSKNTYEESNNPKNYSAPNNAKKIDFHFHTHCGKSDGTMGYGTPSTEDLTFAKEQVSTYGEDNFYIISRKHGLIQYNEFGPLFINTNIPKSLKRYKI